MLVQHSFVLFHTIFNIGMPMKIRVLIFILTFIALPGCAKNYQEGRTISLYQKGPHGEVIRGSSFEHDGLYEQWLVVDLNGIDKPNVIDQIDCTRLAEGFQRAEGFGYRYIVHTTIEYKGNSTECPIVKVNG